MPINIQRILPVLEEMELFSGFSQEEIVQIAGRFSDRTLQPNEVLVRKPDVEGNFYIVIEGSVVVRHAGESDSAQRIIINKGNFFEEETILFGKPESALIEANEASGLLFLDNESYLKLLSDHPKLKINLARTPETRDVVRRQNFDWVSPDEVIYFLARKHEILFVMSLIGPLLLFLISLTVVFGISRLEVAQNVWYLSVICSSSLALAALLWGVWNWIDWGNDFYIVTNQRVVWLEKVIWLYESRDEAPLNTILSVNVTTSLLGRIFNFGNLVVRTFTGEIVFRNMRDYDRMVSVIDEFRQRLQRQSEKVEKREIDRSIRIQLGLIEAEMAQSSPTIPIAPVKKPGFFSRYFDNFFTMRFEQGNVITFRKYWPTLLGKVWGPTVLLIITIFAGGAFINEILFGNLQQLWLNILLILTFLFFIFGILWWIYQYADWRNDIYQVSDKYIFDIERKPLGTEVKKSAPLESILSLEHERVGVLGYLLNYGKVIINVGETKFFFNNVHDPARVQQDIFTRIHALKRQKEIAEAARNRKNLIGVLGLYHEAAEEIREEEYFDDEYDEEYNEEMEQN
jgi:hypothetical protein